jgi:hypothetical protein
MRGPLLQAVTKKVNGKIEEKEAISRSCMISGKIEDKSEI